MKFLWILMLVLALAACDEDPGKPHKKDKGKRRGQERSSHDHAAPAGDSARIGGFGSSPNTRLLGGATALTSALAGFALGVGASAVTHNIGRPHGHRFTGGRPVIVDHVHGGVGHVHGGVSPGFGGVGHGHGVVSPGFGGVGHGHGVVSPGFGGVGHGHGVVSPGFGGVGHGHGVVSPGFGGVGHGHGVVSPGFGGVGHGHGVISPVGPVGGLGSDCRFWCRTPEGAAFCCEKNNQPFNPLATQIVKPGQCPPVRPICPRFGGPPITCSNDGACSSVDKCCFDRCLGENVCKKPLGLPHGR
ncbi:uncharacterized protein LOC143019215 [Oratosquilla oratoria]|uniref:uncharacterized protein LOC143018958 n=1 Tax=Oratosquilla oratoria TaxID=337810 RepID=UPI003F75ED3A